MEEAAQLVSRVLAPEDESVSCSLDGRSEEGKKGDDDGGKEEPAVAIKS